jgi:DCN1-like protein 1/2
LFYKKGCLFINNWNRFIAHNFQRLSFDQWAMFFEFVKETKGCVSNFSDDGSWPSVIDEFIE